MDWSGYKNQKQIPQLRDDKRGGGRSPEGSGQRPYEDCKVSILKYDFGERGIAGMGDGDGDVADAELGSKLGGAAGEPNRRFAGNLTRHFKIRPAHAAAPAGAERFHGRLFYRKPAGVALVTVVVALAIFDFRGGEQPE